MTTTPIRWPRGYKVSFFAKIRKHADKVLRGRVLCVDPATGATSNPGWALLDGGVIVDSGEIAGLRGDTPARLAQLFERLRGDARFQNLDMLVVEQLRGSMVAAQLHWSVGVIIAALPAEIVCELPIPVWKSAARADPTYVKGDEADARAFCATVLAVAAGTQTDDGPPDAARRKRSTRKRSRRPGGVRNAKGSRRTKRGGSRRCRTIN